MGEIMRGHNEFYRGFGRGGHVRPRRSAARRLLSLYWLLAFGSRWLALVPIWECRPASRTHVCLLVAGSRAIHALLILAGVYYITYYITRSFGRLPSLDFGCLALDYEFDSG